MKSTSPSGYAFNILIPTPNASGANRALQEYQATTASNYLPYMDLPGVLRNHLWIAEPF
jgi:hypothetical protein